MNADMIQSFRDEIKALKAKIMSYRAVCKRLREDSTLNYRNDTSEAIKTILEEVEG